MGPSDSNKKKKKLAHCKMLKNHNLKARSVTIQITLQPIINQSNDQEVQLAGQNHTIPAHLVF